MKTVYILNELANFIPKKYVDEIKIDLQNKAGLELCFTLTTIAKNFSDSEENEIYVKHLLEKLCKKHFSIKKTKEEKLLKSLEKVLKSKGMENTDKFIQHTFPNIIRLVNAKKE